MDGTTEGLIETRDCEIICPSHNISESYSYFDNFDWQIVIIKCKPNASSDITYILKLQYNANHHEIYISNEILKLQAQTSVYKPTQMVFNYLFIGKEKRIRMMTNLQFVSETSKLLIIQSTTQPSPWNDTNR